MTESLRGLAASSPSQVGPVRAMRARDVSVPTDADLTAAADTEIIIVSDRRAPSPADLDHSGPGQHGAPPSPPQAPPSPPGQPQGPPGTTRSRS